MKNHILSKTLIMPSLWAISIVMLAACSPDNTAILDSEKALEQPATTKINIEQLENGALTILTILSSDEMEGRRTGTPGNLKARLWLALQLQQKGIAPLGDRYEHEFTFKNRQGENVTGTNLIARIPGKNGANGKAIIVTAHYDHLGIRDGEIFNGADDNASGVAGAFAVAHHFTENPPENDIIIALLDAEEMGLQGARAFLRDKLIQRERIAFNINFDMLSKNDKNELYVAGTYHQPILKPFIETVAANAPVSLKMGHDSPDLGSNDWTLQSDHGPFHEAGINFLYFGVEDHKDYHKTSDVFESVPQDFFMRSVETVIMASEKIDEQLEEIAKSDQ